MQTFLQDLQYAFRMLRKNLGLTLVMGASLGHRNRRQFRHFQRGRCAAAASPAISAPGTAGGCVAAFSRHWHSSGLAFAGSVH